MRDEKKGRSKQGETNKAKQHSTPKAVTFLKKNELPQVGLEPTTLYTLDRALYQLSYQGSSAGWAQISHVRVGSVLAMMVISSESLPRLNVSALYMYMYIHVHVTVTLTWMLHNLMQCYNCTRILYVLRCTQCSSIKKSLCIIMVSRCTVHLTAF